MLSIVESLGRTSPATSEPVSREKLLERFPQVVFINVRNWIVRCFAPVPTRFTEPKPHRTSYKDKPQAAPDQIHKVHLTFPFSCAVPASERPDILEALGDSHLESFCLCAIARDWIAIRGPPENLRMKSKRLLEEMPWTPPVSGASWKDSHFRTQTRKLRSNMERGVRVLFHGWLGKARARLAANLRKH